MKREIVRYCEKSFPPYRHIPGKTPHPVTHPDGHMHGENPQEEEVLEKISQDNFRDVDDYLWGIDLFNHGYFWEAHEAWEGLWKILPRVTPEAIFLQGLIQLSASCLKALDGKAEGGRRLLESAKAKLTQVFLKEGPVFLGLGQEEIFKELSWLEFEKGIFPILVLDSK